MISKTLNIVLADDDKDDCIFFKEALEDLPVSAQLTIVHNGKQMMDLLKKDSHELPDVVFLDLNMPIMNGFECLEEIKANERLKELPIIIFSTSFEPTIADMLYKNGAHYYICKPPDFQDLKKVIHRAIEFIVLEPVLKPTKEVFLLSSLPLAPR